MLLKTALVLLVLWVIGLFGVYQIGKAFHVLLLAGLMLMLFAAAKAREAATRTGSR